jgi:hypothetical protein
MAYFPYNLWGGLADKVLQAASVYVDTDTAMDEVVDEHFYSMCPPKSPIHYGAVVAGEKLGLPVDLVLHRIAPYIRRTILPTARVEWLALHSHFLLSCHSQDYLSWLFRQHRRLRPDS